MQPLYTAQEFSKLSHHKSASIIFGGTFDPIHEGHVADIKFLIKISNKVFIAPTSQNPWKTLNPTPLKVRLKMIKLVLDYEEIKYGPINKAEAECVTIIETPYTYSVDLVKTLTEQNIQNIFWAVGEDLKDSCQKWRDWENSGTPFIVLPLIPEFSATSVRERVNSPHPAIKEFIKQNGLYNTF